MNQQTQSTPRAGLSGGLATLIGAVTVALTAEWTGVAGFIRNALTYLPPTRAWLWWAPVVVALLLLAWSSWYWFVDHTWRDKWVATQAQRAQVAVNRSLGYRSIAQLSVSNGSVVAGQSREPTNDLQVGEAYLEDGLRMQPVKITEPSGQETAFSYALLYDRSSWEHGSITHFMGTDGTPVHVERALAHANIRDVVVRSARVMCFGFASSEREFTEAENERLSDNRAINVCEALLQLQYVDPERQDAIAVGFGEARSARDSVVDTSRERPVVIIGITASPRKPRPEMLIDAIRIATAGEIMAGIDLRNYSRFSTRPQTFLVTGASGNYEGYGDGSRWQTTQQSIYSDSEPIAALPADE